MDYGIISLSHVESYKEAALAEAQGFTHAWFGDSQMVWADVYQCMALCAIKTTTITLGTNVTNPGSRIAPVTACNFATLNVLAPGRVIMGIGTGNTSRRTLGMPAAKLAELRTHVEVCRGLLSGATVPYQEGERRRMIRFLNPDNGMINLRDPIPIYVAASGPKTLELAGEIGDGVILFGTVGDSLLGYTLSHIRRGAERAGRRLEDLYILVLTAFHLTQPEESLAALQQAVGPIVCSECNIFALSVTDPYELPGDIRDDLMAFKDAYRTPNAPIESRHLDLYSGYVSEFKPEHAKLVTERMIKETTLTGTPAEIRARIRKMEALGVKQVAVAGGVPEITDFATHVIQELR
ncbi:MAG TPA: LLM class flavin-dependent oxidoreductase [Candidatus Binatia bacterium]|jgi:5,10-methylenetetrahydromethanopterin reductase|nr:LLM class flavin-dependent oxidoreductase [Candidatus Binatia bacterium]